MDLEEFKAQFEYKPVNESTNRVPKNPIVSVCVITYQHANYIRECLDGILMQKTNFPFEILLGEDDSSDGTREICLEYAEKHPDKIRLFLHHRENNIKINGNPTGRFNFLHNLLSAQGKYIALCEGDDYWTDPLKLQKQVDFLEEHEEYVGVHTNYSTVDIHGNEIVRRTRDPNRKIQEYDRISILREGLPQTLTVVYRKIDSVLSDILQVSQYVVSGDQVTCSLMARHGKIGFIDEVTASRRLGSGTFSTKTFKDRKLNAIKTFSELVKLYSDEESLKALSERIGNLYLSLSLHFLLRLDFANMVKYYKSSINHLTFYEVVKFVRSYVLEAVSNKFDNLIKL